jgi:hypothetical protein
MTELAMLLADTLRTFPLRTWYEHEQRDLQPQVKAELKAALKRRFPDRTFTLTVAVGGRGS